MRILSDTNYSESLKINADNNYVKNSNIWVNYQVWIPINHCTSQILTYTDTDILIDYFIFNDADADTYTDTEIVHLERPIL